MSTLRQQNFLSQQRLDIPHIRAIESGVAADFDLLAGKFMAGNAGVIVSGFNIALTPGLGAPATSLEVVVAGGGVISPHAAEPGGLFAAPEDASNEILGPANPKVSGGFTAATDNYVCLELYREDDSTSKDTVYFLDPTTGTESTRQVALARVLKYRFVITTEDPGSFPDLIPLARVAVGPGGDVSTITDVRPCLFRLASGGSQADEQNVYSWPQGRSVSTMAGGDKAIRSLKEALDAIMTRLWELGGGDAWFHAGTDRDVKLTYGPDVLTNGDNWKWTLGSQTLEWKDVNFVFANSDVSSNAVTDGSAVLLDGQCLYADLVRDSATSLVPQIATMTTLGAPTVPGSRYILAWRLGNDVFIKDKAYEAGRTFAVPATTSALGIVKLTSAPHNSGNPTVVPINSSGTLAYDASTSSPVVSTNINAAYFKAKGAGTAITASATTHTAVNAIATSGVAVSANSDSGHAVDARSDSSTAIDAQTDSISSGVAAVYARAPSGSAMALRGTSAGGIAVKAESTTSIGVSATTDSATLPAVKGVANSLLNTAVGVLGDMSAAGALGAGVKGISDQGAGVEGSSPNGVGVYGHTESGLSGVAGTTVSSIAVSGTATGNGRAGTFQALGTGNALSASSVGGHGVSATGQAAGKSAVFGSTTSTSSSAHGIHGTSLEVGATGAAVFGESTAGPGVEGSSSTGPGVKGSSSGNFGISGGTVSGAAVYGEASGTGNAGLFAKTTGSTSNRAQAVIRLSGGSTAGAIGVDMDDTYLAWDTSVFGPNAILKWQDAAIANGYGQALLGGTIKNRILMGGSFAAEPDLDGNLVATLGAGTFLFAESTTAARPRVVTTAAPIVSDPVLPASGTLILYWYAQLIDSSVVLQYFSSNPPNGLGHPSSDPGQTGTWCYVGCTPLHNGAWHCHVASTGLRKRRVTIATDIIPPSTIESQTNAFYGKELSISGTLGSTTMYVSSGASANNGPFPIDSAIPTLSVGRWMVLGGTPPIGTGEIALNTELSSFRHQLIDGQASYFCWEMHSNKNHYLRGRNTGGTAVDLSVRCIGWDEDLDLLDDL